MKKYIIDEFEFYTRTPKRQSLKFDAALVEAGIYVIGSLILIAAAFYLN